MSEIVMSGNMPVLALRGLAVFPNQTTHFDVGREKSVRALDSAMKKDQTLLLVPQKDILDDDPGIDDLYPIGTVVMVKQVLKSQGENLRVLVTGLCRAKVVEQIQQTPYMAAMVEKVPEIEVADNLRTRALRREANALFDAYLDKTERPAQNLQLRMLTSEDTGFLADSIAQNSGIDYPEKAKLLCQINPVKRLEAVVRLLRQEMQMLQLESDIQEKTRAEIDQDQRDYYLREQMKVIREELGEGDDESEIETYTKNLLALGLETKSEEKLMKDVQRLKKQPFGSAEAAVLRNYLDTILELPWNVTTKSGWTWMLPGRYWRRTTSVCKR